MKCSLLTEMCNRMNVTEIRRAIRGTCKTNMFRRINKLLFCLFFIFHKLTSRRYSHCRCIRDTLVFVSIYLSVHIIRMVKKKRQLTSSAYFDFPFNQHILKLEIKRREINGKIPNESRPVSPISIEKFQTVASEFYKYCER